MQNIAPTQGLNRRARFYIFLGILMALGGFISIALAVLFNFLPPLNDETFSVLLVVCLGVIGIPGVLIGSGMVFRGMGLKKDNDLAYQIGESMRSFIGSDNRYTFIRNISKRGLGYIDGVLVGPPGALVFRTIDYPGEWINERADWRVRNKRGKLKSAQMNPTRECARDVYALRRLLEKNNLAKVPVYGVVVFTNRDVRLKGDGPVVPIAEEHTLYQILSRNYLKDERINVSQVRKAIDVILD
jgi:hypothetical protein